MPSLATPTFTHRGITSGYRHAYIVKIAMVAHTDGSFDAYTLAADYASPVKGYYLTEAFWDPGSTAPTNGSNMQVQAAGLGYGDIFQGALAGLSDTTSARIVVPVRDHLVLGDLIITWTGNSVNGAIADLYLYFEAKETK